MRRASLLHLLTTLFALFALPACGARTAPREPDPLAGDAGALPDAPEPPADAAPDPPDCGAPPTPVGAVRFTVPGVVGRVAIDPEGNYYAPLEVPDGGRGLLSLDACGRERWRATALEGRPRNRYVGGEARLTTGGDVLLTDVRGDAAARAIFRFGTDGAPRPGYTTAGAYMRVVAVPPGRGPLVATSPGTAVNQLEGFDLAGRADLRLADWSNANECAVSGALIGCLDRAYDTRSNRLLWSSSAFEILDGTLRHALPPAIDGDRIYVAQFGISSYVLLAREARTGREVFRTMLARSTAGQTDLLMGAPVVGPSGLIYVYLHVRRAAGPFGQLHAVRRDGSLAWSFTAPATRQEFFQHATHLVGRAGVVYLAAGRAVYAVGADDGALRWMLPVPAGANTPGLALARNGDLALHTDDDRLVVIATESAGLAPAAWPAPGGDARNGNAR